MNKYFNVSLTKSNKSDMNNYNYNFDVASTIPGPTYFPLTNNSVNPVYGNTGNTGQVINGQSYTFVPNVGLYFDEPPTDFTDLFHNYPFIELDVSNWNVSNITNMDRMFYQCSPLATLDVSNWDVSNVTSMDRMFYELANVITVDVSNWNVSSVTNMDRMFGNCMSLTTLDVSLWDVSSVTNMYAMFRNCQSLTTINATSWDVSSVTIMGSMFRDTTNFNENISGWDVNNVTMWDNFRTGSALSTLNTPPKFR